MKPTVGILLLVCFPLIAAAQTLNRNSVAASAVTPDEMSKRLEIAARNAKLSSSSGGARAVEIDLAWPKDEAEYRALGRNVVVLVSAVSWKANELPLKRVYIRTKWNREIPLERISSERSTVPTGSPVYTMLGANREDGFYLAPAALLKEEGEIVADFAVNRTAFRLFRLPAEPPDFAEADRLANHRPAERPDPKALKALIEREYKGFKLPDGLQ